MPISGIANIRLDGIGLPKPDADLIAQRLRRARELDTED